MTRIRRTGAVLGLYAASLMAVACEGSDEATLSLTTTTTRSEAETTEIGRPAEAISGVMRGMTEAKVRSLLGAPDSIIDVHHRPLPEAPDGLKPLHRRDVWVEWRWGVDGVVVWSVTLDKAGKVTRVWIVGGGQP